MTADDRRPFLRRLFTRRLEEAAGPPSTDSSAATPDVPADPDSAPAPAAADLHVPAQRVGADDRTPDSPGPSLVGPGADLSTAPANPDPFDEATQIEGEAPTLTVASVPSAAATVSTASSSAQETGPGSDAEDPRSEDSAAPQGPIESHGADDTLFPDDGHVPSFLDSDFDEDETGSVTENLAATVQPPPAPIPSQPTPDEPGVAQPGVAQPGVAQPGVGEPAIGDLPAPVSPGAVGPALEVNELPDGDQLEAEISAELAAQAPPQASAAPRRAEAGEWRGIVLVTGTDTDVGKTVVTAAIAAAAQASGLRVAVIKPGQTGMVTGAPTDIEVITRLAAPDTVRTLAEYPEPMAPLAAATIAEMAPLELYEVVDAIRAEADKHDLVLVEGAGGLLVPMGVRPSGEAWTLADLATTLGVGALVVARAGLGTLNHTALTLEALARRGVPAGVIIGAWPADPQLVHWANLSEFVPHLVGALPDGAGRMDPGVFRRSAPGWLTPALYGVLDNWRVWAEETG